MPAAMWSTAAWRFVGRKVFVGTLDGRLVALDAATGKPVWDKLTIDRNFRYTITAAPRVVKGKVIIGNGGAEMGRAGIRLCLRRGQRQSRLALLHGAWRSSQRGFRRLLDFWSKGRPRLGLGEWWKFGGGGTVWDSVVYDPDLDLLYIGVGNGSPWNRQHRKPGRRRQSSTPPQSLH